MLEKRDLILAIAVIVLGATGTYLMLPHRHGSAKPRRVHLIGAVLAGLALLLFATFWRAPASAISSLFFYAFSLAAVAGGLLTITSRNPIHSALWFASVVLSTSGLFLLAGAQFLAAGTVIVYAGAIIVTFLFVIMLAQMEGRAPYDRAARAPGRATFSCFLLFWALFYALLIVRVAPHPKGVAIDTDNERLVRSGEIASSYGLKADHPARLISELARRDTLRMDDISKRPKPHVAGLGEALYTEHLISVELAGTLLFVALIGALAIATPKLPIRPGDPRPQPLTKL